MAAILGAGLIPATAAADRPTTEVYSPVGDQFVCDDAFLTVTSGTVLEREHVRELGSGLSHVVVVETPNDVILTDEDGTDYRLVGTARGNFITAAHPEDEFLLQEGFFHFKVNILGETVCSERLISCFGGTTANSWFGIAAAVISPRVGAR